VVVVPVPAPVRLIVTPCGAAPLTVPEMLNVEELELVDDVAVPQVVGVGPPKVIHPEPHPERSTAAKNGKAARIVFM
jgi:hypothetical protein